MSRRIWLPLAIVLCAAIVAVAWQGKRHRLTTASIPAPTKLAPEPFEPLRVRLGGDLSARRALACDGPYRIVGIDNQQIESEGESLSATDLFVRNGSLRLGDAPLTGLAIEVQPQGDAPLSLDGTTYRGKLRFYASGDKTPTKLLVVNVVPMGDYLASVVHGEMPDDFGSAALEAQAIAARSYALFQRKAAAKDALHDLYDDTRSQTYRGIESIGKDGKRRQQISAASSAAVANTRGRVLQDNNKNPFCPFYSACCGGHTLSGREVFRVNSSALDAVPCSWCADAPRHAWQRSLPAEKLAARLKKYLEAEHRSVGKIKSITTPVAAPGTMPLVVIIGSDGAETLRADTFKRHVLYDQNLPSANFTLTADDGQWILKGHGWGHGVGMCQWGAAGMARAGKSCDEILAHYYPGSRVAEYR